MSYAFPSQSGRAARGNRGPFVRVTGNLWHNAIIVGQVTGKGATDVNGSSGMLEEMLKHAVQFMFVAGFCSGLVFGLLLAGAIAAIVFWRKRLKHPAARVE